MMARRLRIGEGDALDVAGRAGSRRFDVVAVTDAVGFVPQQMPYRNAKTYATIDLADADIIAPYVSSAGTTMAVAHGDSPEMKRLREELKEAGPQKTDGFVFYRAQGYRRSRVGETDKDFRIFDLMLALDDACSRPTSASPTSSSSRSARGDANSGSTVCSG